MRVALINPRWTFEGSIYFGCRDPHLPLEHGYAKALLEARGHEVLLIDAHLMDLGLDEVRAELRAFGPDMTVLTTAPTYLFWRCAPPELRVPQQVAAAIRNVTGVLVVVGPHGSATPGPVLEKLGADVVVMGECEEVLARLADGEKADLPGLCFRDGDGFRINGGPQAVPFVDTHHHRFDRAPAGPGAEVEASRGCPYHSSFRAAGFEIIARPGHEIYLCRPDLARPRDELAHEEWRAATGAGEKSGRAGSWFRETR